MNRLNKDCLTCCVGYYFRMNPARIPFFIAHKDWEKRLINFFKRRGLKIEALKYNTKIGKFMAKPKYKDRITIVQGLSPRNKNSKKLVEHAIVWKGNKPIFDPSHDQFFIKGKPTFVWVISKL